MALCYLISCFIETCIMFQFMDERYYRTYQNRLVYVWAGIGNTVITAILNLMSIPILNLSAWMILAGIGSGVLYYENSIKGKKRILECEALLVVISFTESFGVLLVKWIMLAAKAQIGSPVMATCLEVTASKVPVIFVYFTAIRGLVKTHPAIHGKIMRRPVQRKHAAEAAHRSRGKQGKSSPAFIAIHLYSFVNMLVIIQGLSHDLNNGIFAVSMCCIALVDLYLLYFIKATDEKKAYDMKVRALEQQAKLQYDYYLQQDQKYNQTLQILHDVNRHIQSIKELGASGNIEETKKYAEQIGGMLKPLIPTRYTGNAILDILLSDKVRQVEDRGIGFVVNLDGICFDFMEAIDITTIFGNLLDNALEACETVQDRADKKIVLTAQRFQEIVSVTVENDCNPVRWRADMPVSEKGENRGIGLLNVRKSIDKYDGDLKLRECNGKFIAEFFLNT